ncbi:type II secretion system minor pseudopilin GspK [Spongiibacter sp. KMU-166]|uniref:Type II secretion system protein K n=1 Tax=Spongiibacter thalassae TaxID=2721624 RepID=A0ABX1GEF2_9GAMM|nr:type II secretion system minor pseudopilin GspK [Spongiibacter thalassae]
MRVGQARPPGRQRGAALLTVLLMVSIMLVLSVNLVEGVRFNSQRLFNQRMMDQAFWYALGGERIAAMALEDVAGESVIALHQNWARKDIVFPVDGGSIAGLIEDQQACFNVNNLYLADNPDGELPEKTGSELLLEHLFENLELDVQRVAFIVGRLRDWIDEDFTPEGVYGAEDLSYNSADYPYVPPNRPIESLSEMSLFAEFEAEERERLLPLLCALPEVNTAININTLTVEDAPLLAAAIGNVLDVETVRAIIETRPERGWGEVADFVTALSLPGEQAIPAKLLPLLGVNSRYFLGLADVFYEQRQLRIYSRFVLQNGKIVAYGREYGEIF